MEHNGLMNKLLHDIGITYGSRTFFRIYDGQDTRNIDGEHFVEDVLNTAGYFSENQIVGKHVAIAASNSYRWVVVFFALAASGNTVVPLNQELPAEMLQWQCKKADIALVCYDNSEVLNKISIVPGIHFDALNASTCLPLASVHRHQADEPFLMMFTSGTTGMSKAVMLSAKNLNTSINDGFCMQKQTADGAAPDEELLSLPLFHIGTIRCLMSQLIHGGTIAIGRGPKYLFMDIPKLHPVQVAMVPAMAETLAKVMQRTPPEHRARIVGQRFKCINVAGASIKPSVGLYFMEQGIQVTTLFGMTESAGDGTWCPLDPKHIGAIGKPGDKLTCKIQDGEILLQSDSVMIGYYNDPEETAKVIVDGWLHTGDMGHCDEDGYFYLTGRKKNVIILSNGENVNPEEIEATFAECDAIEECLVYSDGKGICADVFTKDQDQAAAFIKQYNEGMPRYRQIYKVIYTEMPLPKTGSGKIKRKENK